MNIALFEIAILALDSTDVDFTLFVNNSQMWRTQFDIGWQVETFEKGKPTYAIDKNIRTGLSTEEALLEILERENINVV